MARIQVYPKIVIDLETTRSEAAIRNALDDFFATAKTKIRAIVDADPNTTIIGWHYHLSTGSVDEVEP